MIAAMPIPPYDPRHPEVAAVWYSYGGLTRFLESTRLALAREEALWLGVEFDAPDAIVLTSEGIAGPPSVYRVAIADHLSALADGEVFAGLVLLKTAALAEALARLLLSVPRLEGGLEVWAPACLQAAGHSPGKVHAGMAGLVETYVHRNAVAHGTTTWSQPMVDRLLKAGGTPPAAGSSVVVAPNLAEFRSRLRSFMRLTGLTVKP